MFERDKDASQHAFTSICLRDDAGDVAVGYEGEMEDVGGLVLACQRVKNLTVNSDLDVLPFCVTHLKHKHTHTSSQFLRNWNLCAHANKETKEQSLHAALRVREVKLTEETLKTLYVALKSTPHCWRVHQSQHGTLRLFFLLNKKRKRFFCCLIKDRSPPLILVPSPHDNILNG